MMFTRFDWVWYAVSALLAVLSLSLAYRGLFRDRARGKRRCPKCWYDMSGTQGLTCSECGHAAPNQRRLLKTRRSWRLLIVSMLALALAYVSFSLPRLTERGWWGFAPTTLLIAAMPGLETHLPVAFRELKARMDSGNLAEWQWRWLLRRCVATPDDIWTFNLILTTPKDGDETLCGHINMNTNPAPSGLITWLMGAPCRAAYATAGSNQPAMFEDVRGGLPLAWAEGRDLGGRLPTLTLENGLRVFHLDVTIHRAAQSAASATTPVWTPIWRTQANITVPEPTDTFVPLVPLEDEAVTLALREATRFQLFSNALDLVQTFDSLPPFDARLPVRMELLRDGTVVGIWYDWWEMRARPDGTRRSKLLFREGFGRIDSTTLDQSQWEVRVTGDQALSRLARGTGHYWSGTFSRALTQLDQIGPDHFLRSAE